MRLSGDCGSSHRTTKDQRIHCLSFSVVCWRLLSDRKALLLSSKWALPRILLFAYANFICLQDEYGVLFLSYYLTLFQSFFYWVKPWILGKISEAEGLQGALATAEWAQIQGFNFLDCHIIFSKGQSGETMLHAAHFHWSPKQSIHYVHVFQHKNISFPQICINI